MKGDAVIKLIGTAYKRDDYTTKEFFDYWRDTHAAISAKSGPIRGYVASEVIRKLHNPNNPDGEGEIQVDGFVEQWWDDEETFEAAMSSENESKAWDDVLNYAKPTGQFWVVKEHVYIPPPITGPGSLTNNVWVA
jgi:uncharacterized protein (TIGR02118 family)